jgi:hypothetical protein
VWRVIRGNLWLILLSLALSAAAGIAWYKFEQKYNPQYRADASVVLEPTRIFDPQRPDEQPNYNYNLTVEQKTHARMLMDPALWMDVITNNQVFRDTAWFKISRSRPPSGARRTSPRRCSPARI